MTTHVQDQLSEQLAKIKNGAAPSALPVENPYEPTDEPRILNGIVVPATSATAFRGGSLAMFVPVSQVKTVRATARGVGIYVTSGQWVLLWVGDDQAERDNMLAGFLKELGEFSRRKR